MQTTKFDPFALIGTNLFNDFNRLFESTGTQTDLWAPRLDVAETDEAFLIRAELPGIEPDSIDVTVEENVLSISGIRTFDAATSEDDAEEPAPIRYRRREIREGGFARKIRLAGDVDVDAVSATSSNGILEITVPKQPVELPRKVTVAVQR